MVRFIALAGQMESAKDTVADFLVKRLNETGGEWKRAAFANAVKNVFQESFGVTREFIEEWKRKPEPPPGMLMNVRKGLQFIGDGFRQIKQDIWIEIALRSEKLIISDSRYINEARHVNEKSGVNVVLWRPGKENNDPNPSEAEIKPIVDWCVNTKQDGPLHWNYDMEIYPAPEGIIYYHYFMRNDGTVDDLYERIEKEFIPWLENRYGV